VSRPPRIAISLGASFLGYATHAGFLARLHELGVRPTFVGGSSAGALAAGLYAAGLPSERIREALLSWRLRWSFARKTRWWSLYPRIAIHSETISLITAEGAVAYFEALVGQKNIEDLSEPKFMAAVSDLEKARTLFLREGSLATAMVASCCIPTIMGAISHLGVQCFDGGVAHETPIDPWVEDPEVDIIVIHRITHRDEYFPKFFPFNLFRVAGQAHSCASEQLMEYRLRIAALHNKKVLVARTVHERPAVVCKRGMGHFYTMGEEAAQAFYEAELKPLLETQEAVV
jgi:predicted acylesterase/phospholipase RssA